MTHDANRHQTRGWGGWRAGLAVAMLAPLLTAASGFAQEAPAPTATAPAETATTVSTSSESTEPQEEAPPITDPMEVFRLAFADCLATGGEGSVCAEQAKEILLAVISGGTSETATGEPASSEAPDAAQNGAAQTTTSGGADGEISFGDSGRRNRADSDGGERATSADGTRTTGDTTGDTTENGGS